MVRVAKVKCQEQPLVTVVRAELVRGHRPVVVSEASIAASLPGRTMTVFFQVPVYIGLKDRDGRQFEDKGNCRTPSGKYFT